jgi:hypothetical protein
LETDGRTINRPRVLDDAALEAARLRPRHFVALLIANLDTLCEEVHLNLA